MTTDEQYVPSDEQMQADWHAYITTPDEENYYYAALSSEEADARWSRWLAAHDARVRRDAAREALDGLADEAIHVDWEMDGPSFALRVRRFKNRKHPEETP